MASDEPQWSGQNNQSNLSDSTLIEGSDGSGGGEVVRMDTNDNVRREVVGEGGTTQSEDQSDRINNTSAPLPHHHQVNYYQLEQTNEGSVVPSSSMIGGGDRLGRTVPPPLYLPPPSSASPPVDYGPPLPLDEYSPPPSPPPDVYPWIVRPPPSMPPPDVYFRDVHPPPPPPPPPSPPPPPPPQPQQVMTQQNIPPIANEHGNGYESHPVRLLPGAMLMPRAAMPYSPALFYGHQPYQMVQTPDRHQIPPPVRYRAAPAYPRPRRQVTPHRGPQVPPRTTDGDGGDRRLLGLNHFIDNDSDDDSDDSDSDDSDSENNMNSDGIEEIFTNQVKLNDDSEGDKNQTKSHTEEIKLKISEVTSSKNVPDLVQLLKDLKDLTKHSNNYTLQADDIGTMVVTLNNYCTEAGIQEYGIPLMINIMKNHPYDVEIQTRACIVLVNFSHCNESSVKKIGNAGCIPIVINALKNHSNDGTFQQIGCEVLWKLSCKIEEHRITINALGGRNLIEKAMKLYPTNSNIQNRGVHALNCLEWKE